MRLWTIVLFVIALNVGFSILNYADIWCSWDDYSSIRITENGEVPYGGCNSNMYANSTTLEQNITEIKTKDIGWGLLSGIPVIGQVVTGVVQYSSSFVHFLSLFTGIFTSIGELMENVGFPSYISWGIQFAMDVVIFYGLLQFILGRSGKTVE